MSSVVVNGSVDDSMRKLRDRHNSILDFKTEEFIQEVDCVQLPGVGEIQVPVVKGNFNAVPVRVQQFIARYVRKSDLLHFSRIQNIKN